MQSYSSFSKALHWVTALLIFGLLSVGFYMVGMEDSPFKFQVYGWHKSFGTLVLLLVIVRVGWKIVSMQPPVIASHAVWEKLLAKLVKWALILGMFAMPLSGWIMSNAGDYPYGFFGLFEMPHLVGKNQALYRLSQGIHEWAAWGIIGALALHMAGAFKHHFIDRDETLQRMTYRRLGLIGGVILTFIAGILWVAPVALSLLGEEDHAQHNHVQTSSESAAQDHDHHVHESSLPRWYIQKEESAIYFDATQYGAVFKGVFENFSGEIFFDPDNLAQSKVDMTIDIGSINTGAPERDTQARGGEWFDVVSFPEARFVSKKFEALGGNQFSVTGDLTLKNMTQDITFPFTLDFPADDQAHMKAELTLNRLEFNIGTGQWTSDEAIGDAVKISIDISALTKPL